MRKTSFRWAVTIKLFKEQGSAGIEQPGPRRASGGAKTVQRTVFRAWEMDAQVIKKGLLQNSLQKNEIDIPQRVCLSHFFVVICNYP